MMTHPDPDELWPVASPEPPIMAATWTKPELLGLLSRWVKDHKTAARAAAQLGVTPQYLSDVLRGARSIGPTILTALGFEVVYRRIHREDTPHDEAY